MVDGVSGAGTPPDLARFSNARRADSEDQPRRVDEPREANRSESSERADTDNVTRDVRVAVRAASDEEAPTRPELERAEQDVVARNANVGAAVDLLNIVV